MYWFSSGNEFFCTKFVQHAVAGKGRNTVLHRQKKCNKLDLTAAQYFSLVDHNDWSTWFAISSFTYVQFQLQLYWWVHRKKKIAKLRHLILLSRVTY
jgi:hypothetical protein